MSETTVKPSLKGPSALLKEAWATFSQSPSTYIKLILLTYLISIGLILGFAIVGLLLYFLTKSPAIAIAIPLVVGVPVFIYVSTWFGVALTHALMSDSEGEHKGTMEALRESKIFIVPYFLTSLLMSIITVGGYFLFIIPGIILQIFFSLYTFIILRENKTGLRALLTSREYIRGYGGVIFIYLLILAIISYVVTFVPAYIFEKMDLSVVASLLNIILGFVLTPVSMLFAIGIYKELKRIKGEVTIENYESRKLKYVGIGILGVVLPIVFIWFVITNILPVFKDLPWSEMDQYMQEDYQMPTEDDFYVYPEAV